jgi:hypothetical protein
LITKRKNQSQAERLIPGKYCRTGYVNSSLAGE